MLKTVYFDLGNVLLFFSVEKMFAQLAECTQIAPQKMYNFFLNTSLREEYEKGLIDTEQLYNKFLAYAPKVFSFQAFTQAFSNIFTPNTELWPVVERLKKEKIRLILLSNTSECHYRYIESHYPILDLFDEKILSYKVGAYKPESEIFQKALALSQCKPEECFYTDDIPEFIKGAEKVGLKGSVFTTVSNLKKQLHEQGCFFF